MRAPQILLGAVSVTSALLAVAPAQGGELPRYSALPSGHVSMMPTGKTPTTIGAREKVAGFFPVRQKFGSDVPAASRPVTVVTDAEAAASIREGSGSGNDAELGACLTEGQQSNHSGEDDDVEAHQWAMGLQREVNLWPKSKDNEQGGVGAVHSEKLVENGGQVTLESIDAWIDPVTLGARIIQRASLPLMQVGSAVGGVKVYAARDERGPNARFVQFVIVRPGTPNAARAGSMMAIRQDGSNAHGNGCGHLRMTLVVGSINDASALVIAPVEISSTLLPAPTAPGDKTSLRDGEDDDDESGGGQKAKPGMKKRRRGPSLPTPMPTAEADAPVPLAVEREVRTRDMQIHLSVSQTVREKEPLLAVSFGWAGRESVRREIEVSTTPPGDPTP